LDCRKTSMRSAEDRFRALLEDTSLLPYKGKREHTFGAKAYGSNHAFLGCSHQSYQNAIDAVHSIVPTVAKKTIGRALREAIVSLFEQHAVGDAEPNGEANLESILTVLDGVDIADELKKLVESLLSLIGTQRVFIPLQGIELKLPRLDIDEVALYPRDGGPFGETISGLGTELGSEEIERRFAASPCYAAIDIEGDMEFAKETALAKTQKAVHILRFLLSLKDRPHDFRHMAKIGIVGQTSIVPAQVLFHVRLPSGAKEKHPEGQRGAAFSRPVDFDWPVDSSQVCTWKHYGLQEIERSFFGSQDPRDDSIPNRIRRAIEWYSQSMNADSEAEQFVAMAVALESLLVGDEGKGPGANWGSITQRIADRVAYLIGQDYDARVGMSKKAKQLYGIRSGIVHQGEPVSAEDLVAMRGLAREAIVAFLEQGFTSWAGFLEWERREKYSH